MSFYKLEATYRTIPTKEDRTSKRKSSGKKTYRYYFNSYESMLISFSTNILNKSAVRVKEISESEYIRGTR